MSRQVNGSSPSQGGPSPTFWAARRVLVTGATGMLGSWLVKELVGLNAHVVALVADADPQSEFYRSGAHRSVSVANGRLEDFWAVERAINEHEIEVVFHLGAQTIVGTAQRFPLPTFEANIRGTYNLLEACRLHPTLVDRVVVASSDKAYGEQPVLPYTEDMPLNGRSPYDVSKSCADLVAQCYHASYRLPVAIARCGNIYGGGDLNWSRIVPGTIRSFLRNQRPVIRSDGTYARDYFYVKDAAQAYMALAEHLDDASIHGQAFNFSTGSRVTVLELVGSLQRLMECEHLEPDVRNTAAGEIHVQHLSAAKAQALLGWCPEFTLQRGLTETIEWYRQFLDPAAR
jgi:CDP-glucose 4,6-dehydratase